MIKEMMSKVDEADMPARPRDVLPSLAITGYRPHLQMLQQAMPFSSMLLSSFSASRPAALRRCYCRHLCDDG